MFIETPDNDTIIAFLTAKKALLFLNLNGTTLMKRFISLSFSLIIFFSLLNFSWATARFYKYVDKEGNLSITDDIKNVPQEYRDKMSIVEFQVEETQKIPQTKPHVSSLKINPRNHSILNRLELLKPNLEKGITQITLILALLLLGGVIITFVINKLFKSLLTRLLLQVSLIIVIVGVIYVIYLSYLGQQLSHFLPVDKEKTVYTPSDILNQVKEITEKAQASAEKRQKLLGTMSEQP